MHGFVALVKNFHKGRDTGKVWPVVVDASAIGLTVISFSGLTLRFYLKRKRIPGLLVVVVGGMAALLAVVRSWSRERRGRRTYGSRCGACLQFSSPISPPK